MWMCECAAQRNEKSDRPESDEQWANERKYSRGEIFTALCVCVSICALCVHILFYLYIFFVYFMQIGLGYLAGDDSKMSTVSVVYYTHIFHYDTVKAKWIKNQQQQQQHQQAVIYFLCRFLLCKIGNKSITYAVAMLLGKAYHADTHKHIPPANSLVW